MVPQKSLWSLSNSSGHWCLWNKNNFSLAPAVIIPVFTTVFPVAVVSWSLLVTVVLSWSALFGPDVSLYNSRGVCRRGTGFTDSSLQDLPDLFKTLSLPNDLQLHLKGEEGSEKCIHLYKYVEVSASAITNFLHSGFWKNKIINIFIGNTKEYVEVLNYSLLVPTTRTTTVSLYSN